jgi:GTP-binding protein HflX
VVDLSHPLYEEQIGVVNKTLQDIKAAEKPAILIFNKIDQYEKLTFDEWLDESVKKDMMNELKERWENETNGNCVFISATEKRNIDELRTTILDKVKKLYKIRYPYKTEFIF